MRVRCISYRQTLFPTSLCGLLVFDSVSRSSSSSSSLSAASLSLTIFHTQLCHTPLCHTPSFTHNFVTHHLSHTKLCHTQLCHTTLSHTSLSHTICHTQLRHTQLCHTPLCHTPSVTHNFVTHNFVAYHLSHTALSHTSLSHTTLSHTTLSHTTLSHIALSQPLCHTHFVTHNFVTHYFVTHHLSHTTLSHTKFVTHNFVTHNFVTYNFVTHHLSVALGGMDVSCAWQVWHLATSTFTLASSPWHLLTSTFVLRGKRGTYGTGLALVARLVPVGRLGRHGTLPGRRGTWRHGQSICGTGVALGDMDVACAWQVWHLATSTFTLASSPWHLLTSTFVLRGKRGTYGTGLALVARLVPVGRPGRHGTLPGRRGTWRHGQSICGTGVALGDMDVACAWQVWHLATSTFTLASSPWHLLTSTFVLRGKRGTYGTGLALVARLVPVGRPGRHGTLPGRRGTWRHGQSICGTGVALADMDVACAWQVWHLATSTFTLASSPWHLLTSTFVLRGKRGTYGTGLALVARLVPVGRPGRHGTLPGRRGTWRHGQSICGTGVALADMDVACAWQVWHLATSTFTLASSPWHLLTSTFVLRGERGTYGTGLALVARLVPVGRPGRHGTLPGRRGTWRHGQSICGTGVALGDMDVACAWQVWHLATSTFTLASSPWHLLTSTFVLRGKRGTYGTGLALVARLVPVGRPGRHGTLPGRRGTWRHGQSICGTGVALGDMDVACAWQVWHLATSTFTLASSPWHLLTSTFVLRGKRGTYGTGLALVARLVPVGRPGRHGTLPGRRGTWRHGQSICGTGVALGDMDVACAWQVWHLATSTFTLASSPWHLLTSTFVLRGKRGTYGTGLALVARLVPVGRPGRHGTLPWHLLTSTFVLRGKRGTYGTGLALVARLVPVGRPGRHGTLPGRRGTWRHGQSICGTGVALGDMDVACAWQVWHLATSTFTLASSPWHLLTSTFVLRGKRGTYGTGLALVARRWSARAPRHLAWQVVTCYSHYTLISAHLWALSPTCVCYTRGWLPGVCGPSLSFCFPAVIFNRGPRGRTNNVSEEEPTKCQRYI